MSRPLLVFKFGGDALATPEHIAHAAFLAAIASIDHDLVVVSSARRGVTDHLLQLWQGVDTATGGPRTAVPVHAELAVATGEIVTASLLAAAMAHFQSAAVPLGAREAGLLGGGPPGEARLRTIRRGRLLSVLGRGEVPVVAGFQVFDQGNVRTLGRGGSDLTAVAIAVALGATRCRFFKLHGLQTLDPVRYPDAARTVGNIDHRGLRQLLADGSKVLHPGAARLAERHRLTLEFEKFPREGGADRSVVQT